VVVTSGTFTPDAIHFAEGKRLELIDGDQLRRLIAEIRSFSRYQDIGGDPGCGRWILPTVREGHAWKATRAQGSECGVVLPRLQPLSGLPLPKSL
jgi:hypothetical protein